jgi:hypothetical protein
LLSPTSASSSPLVAAWQEADIPTTRAPSASLSILATTLDPIALKEEKAKRVREQVLGEILSTEVSYVESLLVLDELYIAPILADANILPRKYADVLFGNIRHIMDLNKRFLDVTNTFNSSTVHLSASMILMLLCFS